MTAFAEYSVISDPSFLHILPSNTGLPWSAFTGICGFVGLTAYAAWKEYSKAKKGETAFVSGGAGAVGSYVVQLAKQDGMKVIASAGSDKKVEFMKSIGANVAFNYKTTCEWTSFHDKVRLTERRIATEDILKQEGPINVYWDNVGGVGWL
jgi:NADPH-dependent curcumin reductase CurA